MNSVITDRKVDILFLTNSHQHSDWYDRCHKSTRWHDNSSKLAQIDNYSWKLAERHVVVSEENQRGVPGLSLGSFRSPLWNRAVRRSTIDELARSRRWRFATVLVCREETGSLASGLLLMMNVPPVNARADAAEAETPTRIRLFHATESNFTVLLET